MHRAAKKLQRRFKKYKILKKYVIKAKKCYKIRRDERLRKKFKSSC
jgi:hypothetical protein